MSDPDETVFITEHEDGSAEFTISVDEEDHKFGVIGTDDGSAIVSYEETLSWRGQVRVSEPREEVFKLLMQSDEMTDYLESQNLNGVLRERHA